MNMLQAKKEELKKQGKKGFTLMELLIVVAIIAVLVAIAIPLFTNQLEKSREATDEANLRGAYAACSAAVLTTTETTTTPIDSGGFKVSYDATTGTATCTVKPVQQETGWQSNTDGVNIGGVTLKTITKGTDVTVSVSASGVTFTQGSTDLSK